MKGKTILTALVLIVALLASLAPAFAGGLNSMEQGKKYVEARMWPQAIAALKEEVKNSPENAEAHFLLGVCYVNTGEHYSAEERFDSAVAADKKGIYGHKIGEVWKNAGMFALNKGEAEKAKELFNKAETYQPGIKQAIALDLLAKGKGLAQKSAYEQADRYFSVALSINPYLEKEVCEAYYSAGNVASDEKVLDFYPAPKPYCGMYNKQVGRRLLEIAKRFARTPGREKEVEKYKKTAAIYLGETVVQIELPNYRIYPPGEHDLGKFKAGEQTDYWITTEPGKTSNLGFLATNKMFKIVFEDGHTVNVWEKQGGELFDRKDKFKIIAVEDVDITMVVK